MASDAPTYRALALQTRCDAIHGAASREAARERMQATLERIGRQIAGSLGWIGTDCRLVVLPEYVLTGHPIGEPIEVWADIAALEPGGAEYEQLGAIAQRHGIHLVANAYETDRHFPGLYFQACVILGPSGDVVLRYRRLNSMFAPTPHDVWDRYLETYGLDGVFPVARTEIGNLACIASEEILFPELVRCLALRGAEVICQPTSEASEAGVRPKDIARRARAIENLTWVVSANTAGITGSPIPGDSTDGGSQIVDHTGRVLVSSGPGETMTAYAEIDLAASRRARRRPGMANLFARNRFDLYAREYAGARFHEANGLDGRAPDRSYFGEAHRAVIERLASEGVIS
jgi:predicted amidohydrolase